MQPTFRLEVAGQVDDIVQRLRRAIEAPELAGHAVGAGRCFDFKVEAADRRFWSPHLGVQLCEGARDGEPATTEIHGRFSPRPEVWTMVMMIYFGAACLGFFALIYAYVEWALGWRPWALLAAPLSLGVIAGLHAASLVGQRLSADQMTLLRSRFDHACELAFPGLVPGDTDG